jgi:hypothetical protein
MNLKLVSQEIAKPTTASQVFGITMEENYQVSG